MGIGNLLPFSSDITLQDHRKSACISSSAPDSILAPSADLFNVEYGKGFQFSLLFQTAKFCSTNKSFFPFSNIKVFYSSWPIYIFRLRRLAPCNKCAPRVVQNSRVRKEHEPNEEGVDYLRGALDAVNKAAGCKRSGTNMSLVKAAPRSCAAFPLYGFG